MGSKIRKAVLLSAGLFLMILSACDIDKVKKINDLGRKVNRAMDKIDSTANKISEEATRAANLLEATRDTARMGIDTLGTDPHPMDSISNIP